MRTLLFTLVLALTTNNLTAQTPSFGNLESTVVLVAQQVTIPSKSTEPALWTALEQHLGHPVLGTALTLSTGTAFYVDTEGAAVTNHHVIDKGNEVQRVRELIKAVQDYVSDEVPTTVLTNDQKFRLRIDIAKLLKGVPIELRIRAPSGTLVPVSVLSDQEKVDLALLRATTSETTSPLVLGADDRPLTVGLPVWAAGLPIPNLFDNLFLQSRVTLTQGIISATRDDVWGIQHTAAINPGNSGGPLLDAQGRVVGVNVARITNANSLFFAIDLSKLGKFFQDSGHFEVWKANQAQVGTAGDSGLLQKTVGDTVVLNALKGTEVFEDGKRIGQVPMVYQLVKKTVLITFKGAAGEATVVLNRDPSIQQTSTVDVTLVPRSGTVDFVSSPAGAIVVVDGVVRGKAPLTASLPGGSHTVQWRLDGVQFEDTKIIVTADQKGQVSAQGISLVEVKFTKTLPAGTRVTWSRGPKSLTVVDPNLWMVAEGTWQVTVENKDYFNAVTVTLDTKSPQIDNTAWFGTGQVVFRNVSPQSVVLIDGVRSGPADSGAILTIPTGRHELTLLAPQREDYVVQVDVKRGALLELESGQRIDRLAEHNYWLGVWGYSTLGLAVVSLPTLYIGLKQQDADMKKNSFDASQSPFNPLMLAGGYGTMASMLTGLFFYMTLNSPVR